MTDLDALRERWLVERPLYQELSTRVRASIEEKARQRGIACIVQGRAKEVASFLKKSLRKVYTDPYDEITDKAGVRVICTYLDDVPAVEEVIRSSFSVLHYDNKTLGLDYDQLGYLGIHFEVQLNEDTEEYLRGLICEVQLHTRAQTLWAEISHELSYKPSQAPPEEIKRVIYRLMSLVEIFDEQVAMARKAILSLPGFQEAQMLEQLERQYYHFTAKDYDRELSLGIIESLHGLFSTDEVEAFGTLMDGFAERHSQKIGEIFREYADDDRCNPLLFQPESLLIYERLEKDPFLLKEAWAASMPVPLLESLAIIWGRSL